MTTPVVSRTDVGPWQPTKAFNKWGMYVQEEFTVTELRREVPCPPRRIEAYIRVQVTFHHHPHLSLFSTFDSLWCRPRVSFLPSFLSFIPRYTTSRSSHWNCRMTFRDSVLCIPPLHIIDQSQPSHQCFVHAHLNIAEHTRNESRGVQSQPNLRLSPPRPSHKQRQKQHLKYGRSLPEVPSHRSLTLGRGNLRCAEYVACLYLASVGLRGIVWQCGWKTRALVQCEVGELYTFCSILLWSISM